jgi:hypothetical protein
MLSRHNRKEIVRNIRYRTTNSSESIDDYAEIQPHSGNV